MKLKKEISVSITLILIISLLIVDFWLPIVNILPWAEIINALIANKIISIVCTVVVLLLVFLFLVRCKEEQSKFIRKVFFLTLVGVPTTLVLSGLAYLILNAKDF